MRGARWWPVEAHPRAGEARSRALRSVAEDEWSRARCLQMFAPARPKARLLALRFLPPTIIIPPPRRRVRAFFCPSASLPPPHRASHPPLLSRYSPRPYHPLPFACAQGVLPTRLAFRPRRRLIPSPTFFYLRSSRLPLSSGHISQRYVVLCL